MIENKKVRRVVFTENGGIILRNKTIERFIFYLVCSYYILFLNKNVYTTIVIQCLISCISQTLRNSLEM